MNQTVFIDIISDRGDVKLTWDQQPEDSDILVAFADLVAQLDTADEPLHVVVDMRTDPRIPLGITLKQVRQGPARHPMMGKWLCIGGNMTARAIADAMNRLGIGGGIYWYDTMDELAEGLYELTGVPARL